MMRRDVAECDDVIDGRAWFVACLDDECKGRVFGPLWTERDARHEASEETCDVRDAGGGHVFGSGDVADYIEVCVPPTYYASNVVVGLREKQARTVAWLDARIDEGGGVDEMTVGVLRDICNGDL